MQILSIPFVQHVGIEKLTEDTLTLNNQTALQNHLGTLHAGALYTLAETQSGLCLQRLYPELVGKTVPVLREGSMKYKNPVSEEVYALFDVSEEERERFEKQFFKKGRGVIAVTVRLMDEERVCAEGRFVWFVQRT